MAPCPSGQTHHYSNHLQSRMHLEVCWAYIQVWQHTTFLSAQQVSVIITMLTWLYNQRKAGSNAEDETKLSQTYLYETQKFQSMSHTLIFDHIRSYHIRSIYSFGLLSLRSLFGMNSGQFTLISLLRHFWIIKQLLLFHTFSKINMIKVGRVDSDFGLLLDSSLKHLLIITGRVWETDSRKPNSRYQLGLAVGIVPQRFRPESRPRLSRPEHCDVSCDRRHKNVLRHLERMNLTGVCTDLLDWTIFVPCYVWEYDAQGCTGRWWTMANCQSDQQWTLTQHGLRPPKTPSEIATVPRCGAPQGSSRDGWTGSAKPRRSASTSLAISQNMLQQNIATATCLFEMAEILSQVMAWCWPVSLKTQHVQRSKQQSSSAAPQPKPSGSPWALRERCSGPEPSRWTRKFHPGRVPPWRTLFRKVAMTVFCR